MIEYNPEDVKENNDYSPWEVGNYESEIIEAVAMESKAGNDMIRLNLMLTNDDGGTTRIYDYIMIQIGIDKGNEKYPPKNVVKKYIDGIGVQTKVEKPKVVATPPIAEDDIPF